MKKAFVLILLVVSGLLTVFSQDTALVRQKAVKVFIDCQGYCDMQYIKDHVLFVNYVRDAYESDVYVLIVSESAGNNGERYTLIFEGQNRFKGQNDTLRFFTKADETNDEIRHKIVKYIKIGLLPYVAHSPLLDYLTVDANLPQKGGQKEVSTQWNNWIFKLSASGYGSGESSYKRTNLSTSFKGSRVTNDWIIDFGLSGSWNFSTYQISENYTYHSKTVSASFNSLIVRSISDHWSVGAQTSAEHSTYRNIALGVDFKPGIEYNLFPYSESTVHQLRVLYVVGPEYYFYIDTTIFEKTQELLFRQKLSIAYEVVKKWGSIDLSVNGRTYLHDFTKNSLTFSASVDVRVFKGMSVFMTGSFGLVHDQLYLPKGGASLEEILTRQQALATQYNYFVMAGISYTFGDIFNNVVNPRFGYSGGGGGMVIYY